MGHASLLSFPLLISLGHLLSLGTDLGGGHKGSLQRAVTARTADRKPGQNVRRHDLHRSHSSMNKQKKKPDCSLLPRGDGFPTARAPHCSPDGSTDGSANHSFLPLVIGFFDGSLVG